MKLSKLFDRPSRTFTLCLVLIFVFNLTVAGQNMSGMPDYGSYVHTGAIDVVNAVDGQVSITLPLTSHSYRAFPYQFGLRYSSDMWRLNTEFEPCNYSFNTHQNCAIYRWSASSGGWQASSNQGGALRYSDTLFTCTSIFGPESPYFNVRAKYAIRSNYVFQDATGRIYQFPVRK